MDKLCWWCKHFYYSNAHEDWSDVTPGYDFAISCSKGHWDFSVYSSPQEHFAKCITAARTCNDFVQIENLK
jgi:hypothetical protein